MSDKTKAELVRQVEALKKEIFRLDKENIKLEDEIKYIKTSTSQKLLHCLKVLLGKWCANA